MLIVTRVFKRGTYRFRREKTIRVPSVPPPAAPRYQIHQAMSEHGKCSCARKCNAGMSRFITKHPLKFLGVSTAIVLLITIAGAIGGAYNLSEFSDFDWAIPNGRGAIDYEAWQDAQARAGEGNVLTQEQVNDDESFRMLFSWGTDSSIFTAANVQTMCQVEQQFLLTKGYYSDFCVINGTSGVCAQPERTITYTFYGSAANPSCPLLSEASVTATATQLYNDLSDSSTRQDASFFMEGNTESRSPPYTTQTRSAIDLGEPLKGYKSTNDRSFDQTQDYLDFYSDVDDNFQSFFGMKSRWLYSAYRDRQSRNGLDVKWFGGQLGNVETSRTIIGDFLLAIFSALIVLVWMAYHLQSVFLSIAALLQIVLSLPVSIVIYRFVWSIPYFNFLHILVIFLVLGIGADDVFVFIDGWRQAEEEAREIVSERVDRDRNLFERMKIAYAHTTSAVFNTSFTTCVAFLATAVSPIMPIATFGILAATAILINYLFVITLTPAIAMVHHVWIRRCGFWCCKHTRDPADSPKKASSLPHEDQKNEISSAGKGDAVDKRASTVELKRESVADLERNPDKDDFKEDDSKESKTPFEQFMEYMYIPAMTWKPRGKIPWVAVGVFAFFSVYAIISIAFAARLGPADEQERWLPDDHMFIVAQDDNADNFIVGDLQENILVGWPFGIKGFERPNFNPYEPGKDRGNVEFDDNFNFFLADSQRTYNEACRLAKDYSCNKKACQFGLLVYSTIDGGLKCWLSSFQNWFEARHGVSTFATANETFFYSQLKAYRNDHLADDGLSVSDKQRLIGFVDGQLKYVAIELRLTATNRASTVQKDDVRDVLDDMVDQVNNQAPTGMNNGRGAAFTWVFVESELGVVRGFFTGLTICFPVAFIVLILATSNVIVSIYAIGSIGFIVCSVLAMVYWRGWDLGIAEAVAGIIIIGFSVDYVIHLGHMFVEAYRLEGVSHPLERFAYAAKVMGATVIAGGVTTFGAALPLFASQLTFFPKMAALMTSTIAFSLMYSIGFFMAAVLLFGPHGKIGDLSWIANKIGLAPCLAKCGIDVTESTTVKDNEHELKDKL